MYGYIYLTTNLINNKKYIGRHKTQVFDNYYKGSGRIIKEAIKKYGRENFKCEVLEWCETKEIAFQKEDYWVQKFNAVEDPMFYNLTAGGSGPIEVPEDVKERLRKAFAGENNPAKRPEVRKKISEGKLGIKNPMYGKHFRQSEAQKEKVRLANLGKKHSKETVEKMRLKKLGQASKKRQAVLCIETNIIYSCARLASEALGINITSNICQCCRGKRKTAGGYHWRYLD